jgi:hypothetical protein
MPEVNSIQLELIQNMSREEIEDRIDVDELKKIKETDKKPIFDVFRIAHAGLSKSYIIGMGNKVLRWFNKTVKAIHNSVKIGTKAFYNHIKDSISHVDREEVGHLVGKYYEEDEDGTANAYGILYRYPGTDLDYDMASYEGKTLVPSIDADGWDVSPEDVREVSGISLGRTEENSPAFPKAKRTLQFCIQNMVKEKEDTESKDEKPLEKKPEEKVEKKEEKMEFKLEDVKIDDLKKEIIKRNLVPSELFNKAALSEDDVVIKMIHEGNREAHHKARRGDDKIAKLEAEVEDLKEKLSNKDAEISVGIIAEKKIVEIFEGRKLSDKNPVLEKWAKRKLKNFKPTGEQDKIEDEAKKYIDELVDEFTALEKDGLMIALKEEKEEKKKDEEKPKKEDEKEKDIKKEKSDDLPAIEYDDIIDPDLAKKVQERVAAWNK